MKTSLSFILVTIIFGYSLGVSAAPICDQTFEGTLRVGFGYTFGDMYTNPDGFRHNIAGGNVTIDESSAGDLNRAGGPGFTWTQQLLAQDYEIAPGQTIQALSADTPYYVYDYPVSRDNKLLVVYSLDVQGQNPDGSWTRPPITHNECKSYTITRCGDGFIDPGYETCDPAAPGQSPTTCSVATCTPITPPPVNGVCDPARTGVQPAPITAGSCTTGSPINFTAVGTNPANYAWNCTGNNGGSTAACTASYTPPAPTAFDLSIKKYVESNDAQSGSAVAVNTGSGFNYVIRVKNEGTGATYGVTTVRDILPAGVTLSGTVTGAPWVCTTSGQSISCTSSAVIAAGATFSDIIVPVRVTATTGTIMNNALVHNPNETNPCKTDGSMPAGDESACIKDPKNVDPAYIVVNPVGSPLLTIRKFAKGVDSQTQTGQVAIGSGEVYPYTFIVTNSGTAAALGARVIDTLPVGIEIIGTPTGTGWACTMSGQMMDCLYNQSIAPGVTVPTITAQARIRPTVAAGTSIRNVAAVCARDPSMPATDPANACVPDAVLCKIGDLNYDPVTKQCDPATVVLTGTGFDLSLKKYIGINDAQVGSPLSVSNGAVLNYVIRVTNSGPESSSGVTTVQDILPTGVVLDGTASGSSWSCTTSSGTILCTSSLVVASGSTYPDITVPFRVTATAGQTVTNIAAVDNPLEVNRCMADGSALPATVSATCTRDANNSDPAVLTVSGGSTGGTSHVGPKCVNSVKSCALYNSLVACEAEVGVGNCDSSDAPGQARCAAKTLTCSGPGGPTPGGPGNPYGTCGDGVLGSSAGEECDLGAGNSNDPRVACSRTCKLNLWTNPGANPITSMWMRIPALGGSRHLGTAGYIDMPLDFDGSTSDSYKIVVGRDTNVFTLADQLIFGVTTQYQIPIIIPADKKMCLQANGATLNSPDGVCTTFGAVAPQTTINGAQYVVLGGGTYQQKIGNTNTYEPKTIRNPVHEALLFKGSTQYSPLGYNTAGPTLRDAFKGAGVVSDNGSISLFGCSGSDCSPTAITTMIQIPVRVSGAVVSSIGSASNRALESFLGTVSPFAGFLGTTNMNTSTTSNNTSTTTTLTLPTLVGKIGRSISTIAELESYGVNGNKNILAVTGDLTITCPAGSTVFTMTGVRTVVVSGNLIIACNIVYGSSDTTSSWAWITKGGDIQVSNGTGPLSVGAVTNLAGVYVAVKESVGGDITYIPTTNATTQAILRVEGTLYGNASPLFQSRLYARATGAYDILTTGTILTYSNRALVSPPPLLSQYLGTYQVQRVVQ